MSRRQDRISRIRRSLRSIESAAIAGIVFSVLFVAALLLMSDAPAIDAPPDEISRFYDDPDAFGPVLIGLNLVPVSIIGLLWFIAVIRRRIGSREDKLFSTVFLGGGLLFGALVLVGAAAAAAPALVSELSGRPPEPDSSVMMRAVGSALLAIHAPRLGSLFIFSASTLGLRTGAFPRWLSLLGYVLGLALLGLFAYVDLMRYAFPVWVGVASVALLIRSRSVSEEIPASPNGRVGDSSDSPTVGDSDEKD